MFFGLQPAEPPQPDSSPSGPTEGTSSGAAAAAAAGSSSRGRRTDAAAAASQASGTLNVRKEEPKPMASPAVARAKPTPSGRLTHVDKDGRAAMVDVGKVQWTLPFILPLPLRRHVAQHDAPCGWVRPIHEAPTAWLIHIIADQDSVSGKVSSTGLSLGVTTHRSQSRIRTEMPCAYGCRRSSTRSARRWRPQRCCWGRRCTS